MASPNTIDSAVYGITVGNAAIEQMQSTLKPLSVFSTNYSGEMADKDATIKVPVDSAITVAADKTEGSAYTRQATTRGKVSVTLGNHKYVSWAVTDNESNSTNQGSLEALGRGKGQKLAIAVSDDILGEVLAANFSTAAFTGAASTFDYDDVVDLAGVADAANWPTMGRALVLSPSYYNALFKDNITGNLAESSIHQSGSVPNLMGFDTHKHMSIPGNSENLVGFITLPSALAIVNRYMAPAGGGRPGSIYRSFTHGETGLTLGYREFYDDDEGERVAILECWYGFETADGTALDRLVSA